MRHCRRSGRYDGPHWEFTVSNTTSPISFVNVPLSLFRLTYSVMLSSSANVDRGITRGQEMAIDAIVISLKLNRIMISIARWLRMRLVEVVSISLCSNIQSIFHIYNLSSQLAGSFVTVNRYFCKNKKKKKMKITTIDIPQRENIVKRLNSPEITRITRLMVSQIYREYVTVCKWLKKQVKDLNKHSVRFFVADQKMIVLKSMTNVVSRMKFDFFFGSLSLSLVSFITTRTMRATRRVFLIEKKMK